MRDAEPVPDLPVCAHATAQGLRTPRALLVATMPWVFHARLASALRGIGMRIEDDVLVTPQGHEVLTAAIPKQPAELEALR